MAETADVLIAGAGISGLVDAILLAETGRRVLVCEQHRVPGGYLQQFRRKKTTFDVGFHYMGSTEPGRPMRVFLEYLDLWRRLELVPLPDECAIEVCRGERRFGYPGRFDRFIEKAHETWPHERDAIDRFVDECRATCREYKWFHLDPGLEYSHPLELDHGDRTFADYMDERIEDPWLREVLSFMTFSIGLYAHEIPWSKHLLAFRSNFDRTCRIRGGGGALIEALVERGRELGVEYRFGNGLARLECEGRTVVRGLLEDGTTVDAAEFVAACHPKLVMDMLSDDALKPMYKERVRGFRDSRGALQLFVRLAAPLESIGAGCLLLRDARGASAADDVSIDVVLVTAPDAIEADGTPRLEAMTYVSDEPFRRWRETRVLKRGAEYEALKSRLAERMIALIETAIPELRDRIVDVYTATPLTDEWYTRNVHGGVFGISHDVEQMGTNRPMPRMRFRNLFFTGHSIMMPGICGTFINAFNTCEWIRGDEGFFERVVG